MLFWFSFWDFELINPEQIEAWLVGWGSFSFYLVAVSILKGNTEEENDKQGI